MNIRFIRLLSAALMLIMVMSAPAALAVSNFEAVVTSKTVKVYRVAEPHDLIGTLPKGTVVTVRDYNKKAALISYMGYNGIVPIGDLEKVSAEEPAEETVSAPAENTSSIEVKYVNKTVLTAEVCRVYAKPTSSSAHVSIDKGVVLTLVATQGDWAMVKKNGKVGYVDKSSLTSEVKVVDVSTAEITTTTPGSGDIFSGSNQEIIFKFLTREMGLNPAAACGVLSNIKYESDYKPTCGGDNGTSYGICQWHADRKTRMINWCNNHGYDSNKLKGQLYFLQYELKTYYPAILKKLKSVSNTAQGAYDAAYDFCYNFEAPANRASRSVTRATYARDTLWGKYRT